MSMAALQDLLQQRLGIEQWSAFALDVPLRKPYRSAKGTLSSLPMLHTEVRTHESVVGHSVVFIASVASLTAAAAIVPGLRQDLGTEKRDIGAHGALLRHKLGTWGREGIAACAVAAFEWALLDACSQRDRRSVGSLLGSTLTPLATYAGIDLGEPSESADDARKLQRAGHRAFKLKLGHSTVEEDIAVLRSVRDAVGESAHLMADYNQSLTVAEALQRCRALDCVGLVWIEEPVRAWDLKGHAAIAEAVATPIQSGENWWQASQIERAIELHSCDAVMLDPTKLGPFGWFEATRVVRDAGMPISSHLSPHLCTQLLHVSGCAGWLEWSDWWEPFLGSVDVRDGTVHPIDTPFDWDEASLKALRAHWPIRPRN
jgi:mandelate racemase